MNTDEKPQSYVTRVVQKIKIPPFIPGEPNYYGRVIELPAFNKKVLLPAFLGILWFIVIAVVGILIVRMALRANGHLKQCHHIQRQKLVELMK